MKKKWLPFFLLFGIFLLALFLRLLYLSVIPNGLHQDELNAGYQGYKLIKTATDLRGEFLPLAIDRFGDFRPAGIFYVDGLSTLLLGLNTFAIRFPSAFIGALTIFPVYFLAFLISKKKGIGLLAALFIAISPWHIIASRATSEQVIALFLIVCGVVLLLKGLEEKLQSFIIGSGILLFLSYFFYHTPRIFIPVFLTLFGGLFLFHPLFASLRRDNALKKSLIGLWIFLCIITGIFALTKSGVGRFTQTSIFSSTTTSPKIKALSDTDQNVFTARIFHNKAVIYTKTFLDQYLSYFSMDFLFIKGGLPDRYVVPDMGLFYYIELPCMLLGFYFLLKKKDTFFSIPLLWLLVGPLAAAVTTEDIPNIQRALFMLPAFQVFEAYGLYYLFERIGKSKKIVFSGIFGAFLLINMVYFYHQYFVHSPSFASYSRDDGTELLFQNLQGKEAEYENIYLSSSQDLPLYYFYLHYTTMTLPQFTQKDIDNGFRVGKYVFVRDLCPERVVPFSVLHMQKALIVDSDGCFHEDTNLHAVDTVYRRDGTTAYILKAVN